MLRAAAAGFYQLRWAAEIEELLERLARAAPGLVAAVRAELRAGAT